MAKNLDGEIMTVRVGKFARQHGIGDARIIGALETGAIRSRLSTTR